VEAKFIALATEVAEISQRYNEPDAFLMSRRGRDEVAPKSSNMRRILAMPTHG
jgi:hypothetical protein